MTTLERRYDIDWLRVIAIGLLLIYHIAIGFQPWAVMIQFIGTKNPWESIWLPMAMINIWRIPLLFFVSGMGVYFALRKRNWSQLIRERTHRILLPFVFGMFFIVPVHIFIWQQHYSMGLSYSFHPAHLWFLANIFLYVIILSPVFIYFKKNEEGKLVRLIKRLFHTPLGLIVLFVAFVLEALLFSPRPFEKYAMTWHGFFLGLLAFFFGFCFVMSGKGFRNMIFKWRWLLLAMAVVLFILRITYFNSYPPIYLLPVESISWIISVFAFGYKYLNKPGKTLRYLSQAAYPVYIVHMIFLYIGSALIFQFNLAPLFQFILLLVFTFIGCFIFYEFFIRRIDIIRPLFGLKRKEKKQTVAISLH